MAGKLDGARELLARANRMIANEGVLDAFGHVTMRHPDDPQRYLMSRSRAPELVQPEDVLEFTLDSQPVNPSDVRLYGERVIHGGIYQARPDVNAVCHHHVRAVCTRPVKICREAAGLGQRNGRAQASARRNAEAPG